MYSSAHKINPETDLLLVSLEVGSFLRPTPEIGEEGILSLINFPQVKVK